MRKFLSILAAIWAVPVAAEAKPVSAIVRAEPVSAVRAGHCENPQWSRDGRALAYERVFLQDRKIELNVLNNVFAASGQRSERRVALPLPAESEDVASARKTAARFKKDGRAPLKRGEVCRELTWGPKSDPDIFAYACNESGGTYQLFWNEGTPLTSGPSSYGQPALSPQGWRLAFVAAADGPEGLSLIDDLMEGTSPRDLARSPGRLDRTPVWSPDGKSLVFVGHRDQGADIYLTQNVGDSAQTITRLTSWADDELNPSWSPKGDRIAFFARRSKKTRSRTGYDLYVLKLAKGAEPYRVAQNVVLNEKHGPAWTPDGRHLVFVKNMQRGHLVDPLRAVSALKPGPEIKLPTSTVSNQDPTVVAREGRWWMAFTALGYHNAQKLAWRRVFIAPVDLLQN